MMRILPSKPFLAGLVAVSLFGQPPAQDGKTAYRLTTDARLAGFLKARKEDLRSGAKEPYHAFLEELIAKGTLPERIWALTRETEAGDYKRFNELLEHMIFHVQGSSKARSRHKRDVLPESISKAGEVFRIHQNGPWWVALEKSIRESADREVPASLYALWCYNTRPSQRELMFEIAGHIQVKAVGGTAPDPWNDPRFWIVMDWIIAWGGPEDFDRMEHVLPKGLARDAFLHHTKDMIALPGFFACTLPTPDMDGVIESPKDGPSKGQVPEHGSTGDAAGDAIPKVKRQPVTPDYPQEARSRRLMTRLTVRSIVGVDGAPCGYRPLPGPWLAFFAPYSVKFLNDWRFEPATSHGVPQPIVFNLIMPFQIIE
jgi:hypothetical protein